MNYGPSTQEWIKKMHSRYAKKYYSVIKSNKTGSSVKMWMDLESIIQKKKKKKKKSEKEKQIL